VAGAAGASPREAAPSRLDPKESTIMSSSFVWFHHNGKTANENLFWQLAAELQNEDARVQEGTIMNGRCLRVGKEFLALVDYKGSGLVVKLPRKRVAELIQSGAGKPFGPAGKVFGEWVSVPTPDPDHWRHLLREGIDFVGR
jgi:hypothetical protein